MELFRLLNYKKSFVYVIIVAASVVAAVAAHLQNSEKAVVHVELPTGYGPKSTAAEPFAIVPFDGLCRVIYEERFLNTVLVNKTFWPAEFGGNENLVVKCPRAAGYVTFVFKRYEESQREDIERVSEFIKIYLNDYLARAKAGGVHIIKPYAVSTFFRLQGRVFWVDFLAAFVFAIILLLIMLLLFLRAGLLKRYLH